MTEQKKGIYSDIADAARLRALTEQQEEEKEKVEYSDCVL